MPEPDKDFAAPKWTKTALARTLNWTCHWIALAPLFGRSWIALKTLLGRSWAALGAALGPILDEFWINFGNMFSTCLARLFRIDLRSSGTLKNIEKQKVFEHVCFF